MKVIFSILQYFIIFCVSFLEILSTTEVDVTTNIIITKTVPDNDCTSLYPPRVLEIEVSVYDITILWNITQNIGCTIDEITISCSTIPKNESVIISYKPSGIQNVTTIITNLTQGVEYKCFGKLRSPPLESNNSEEVTVKLKYDYPRNLNVLSVILDNDTNTFIITLTWQYICQPIVCNFNILILGHYSLDTSLMDSRNYNVSLDNKVDYSFQIVEVWPSSEYNFIVTALYDNDTGNASSINYRTNDTPAGPPTVAVNQTDHHLNIAWVPSDQKSGKIVNYILNIERRRLYDQPSECPLLPMLEQYFDYNTNNYSFPLSNESYYTDYKISVLVNNSAGYGKKGYANISTPQGVPEKPVNLTVTVNEESISISWLLPCLSNGEIDYFSISRSGFYTEEPLNKHIYDDKLVYYEKGKYIYNTSLDNFDYSFHYTVGVKIVLKENISGTEATYSFITPVGHMSTKFGIITVSDSCSAGEKPDIAGTRLIEAVKKRFADAQVFRRLVADEKDDIIKVLQELTDTMDVVLTIGGTGFTQRDVTPEATRAVIEKEAPGLAYAMVSRSLQITEMAMLSRAICGIRKKSLIVNLPGSAKAAVECFGFIQEAIPHAVALLTDNKDAVTKDHYTIQKETKVQLTESKVKMGKVAARNRQSPYPMIEVEEAQKIIFKETHSTVYNDVVSFEESIDRILADDIIASESVPPFRASIKDGYAVKSADGASERGVVEVAAAGDAPDKVSIKDGEAVRISTGAPIPEGADAVVQVEDTVLIDNTADNMTELKIGVKIAPTLGQDIREIGSDVKVGELVLRRYNRVTPAHVGVLAMLGIKKVRIMRSPLIGIISTGNEVQHPLDELKPGQIWDSNKYTLLNFLRKYSYQPRDYGIARDNPNSIKKALEEAFAENDFVITSGGVSMGEFDIIKKVLVEDFNAIIHFGRVNMKPGKPTTFATLIYNGKVKMFFGLPGNPVSCCVTCILFVIPALRYFERSSVTVFPSVFIPCIERNSDNRPDYRRVIVKFDDQDHCLTISSFNNQVSSKLNSMVGANGLTIVENNKLIVARVRRTIIFDQLY